MRCYILTARRLLHQTSPAIEISQHHNLGYLEQSVGSLLYLCINDAGWGSDTVGASVCKNELGASFTMCLYSRTTNLC